MYAFVSCVLAFSFTSFVSLFMSVSAVSFPPFLFPQMNPLCIYCACLPFAFCLCVSVVFSHLFAVNWITFVFLSQILILDCKLAIIQVLCVLFPPAFGVCFWLPLHLTSLLWSLSSARPFCSELPLYGYFLLSRESHMGKIPVDKRQHSKLHRSPFCLILMLGLSLSSSFWSCLLAKMHRAAAVWLAE